MTKETLITWCKFYKGEETCPKTFDKQQSMLWDFERSWVNETVRYSKPEFQEVMTVQDEETYEYMTCGLLHFQENDDIPISLKQHIFHRMTKSCYSIKSTVEPFKEIYLKYYT